ncbi:hypothetical protein [Rhodothermus bifroesti]|uniref:hypothetical protein n=1 Tax=Rhodothermus bifroesti TaxID=2823335 RepID=UPI000CCA450E|nr:hypothetical protein [Rhodothermus bifroesti]GBD01313.1 hypothetical protein HRbin18_01034 [bacterium HR18]
MNVSPTPLPLPPATEMGFTGTTHHATESDSDNTQPEAHARRRFTHLLEAIWQLVFPIPSTEKASPHTSTQADEPSFSPHATSTASPQSALVDHQQIPGPESYTQPAMGSTASVPSTEAASTTWMNNTPDAQPIIEHPTTAQQKNPSNNGHPQIALAEHADIAQHLAYNSTKLAQAIPTPSSITDQKQLLEAPAPNTPPAQQTTVHHSPQAPQFPFEDQAVLPSSAEFATDASLITRNGQAFAPKTATNDPAPPASQTEALLSEIAKQTEAASPQPRHSTSPADTKAPTPAWPFSDVPQQPQMIEANKQANPITSAVPSAVPGPGTGANKQTNPTTSSPHFQRQVNHVAFQKTNGALGLQPAEQQTLLQPLFTEDPTVSAISSKPLHQQPDIVAAEAAQVNQLRALETDPFLRSIPDVHPQKAHVPPLSRQAASYVVDASVPQQAAKTQILSPLATVPSGAIPEPELKTSTPRSQTHAPSTTPPIAMAESPEEGVHETFFPAMEEKTPPPSLKGMPSEGEDLGILKPEAKAVEESLLSVPDEIVRPDVPLRPTPAAIGSSVLPHAIRSAAWIQVLFAYSERIVQLERGKALEVTLADGSGTMHIRAQRETDRVTVAVHFSDPTLRALAAAHADRIQEALQAQYQTAVQLSLTGGESQSRGWQTFTEASENGTTLAGEVSAPASEASPTSPSRAMRPGSTYEWIG